jgi:hypothetical protein
LSGCAAPQSDAEKFNPMPELWASTVAKMNLLKQIKATRIQWTKAANEASSIKTLAQLHDAIGTTGGTTAEADQSLRDQLEDLFRTSHRTILFSWECDYNELVFFDAEGRQRYVYP